MSSRFVPAGSDPVAASSDDGWEKARQKVEERRNVKSVEPGKQEDGKSLYEVLQANKAAKQEAFEEATKVRNQFRSLDDSEIEFLDSIRENERAKEHSVRQETAEQLELFRKQQAIVEQGTVEADDTAVKSKQQPSANVWTALKKRRRDNDEQNPPVPKLRKSSSNTPSKDHTVTSITDRSTNSAPQSTPKKDVQSTTDQEESSDMQAPKPEGLGLVGYSSDDD